MADEIQNNIAAPNNDEKNIATITHLAGTVFFFIPALVVWILKKDDSAYLADQAKEALAYLEQGRAKGKVVVKLP